MKEHSCRNSNNKSGKSVSSSVKPHRRGSPLVEKTNNNHKKEGYVRDDGDWGTTEMRGAKKY